MVSKQIINVRPRPISIFRKPIPLTGSITFLPVSIVTYSATNGWKTVGSDVFRTQVSLESALGSLNTELGEVAYAHLHPHIRVLTFRKGALILDEQGASFFSSSVYELSYELGENVASAIAPNGGRLAQVLL